MNLLGRRFIFATIAIVCATVTTIYLRFDADSYIKLLGIVIGVFTISQTVTDTQKIKQNGGENK